MRNSILLALLCLPLLTGCNKKYKCGHSVFYSIPVYFSFAGFAKQDIDTFVIATYQEPGASFLLSRDTVYCPNPHAEADTLYRGLSGPNNDIPVGFLQLEEGVAIKVTIPSLKKDYWVTGVSSGPGWYEWEQDKPCSMVTNQTEEKPLQNIQIDKVPVTASMNKKANSYFIYIKK